MSDWWKDIPGTDGKYQASKLGEIRRVYPSGKTRKMTVYPHQKRSGLNYEVKLTVNGKSKDYEAYRLIGLTFLGPTPEGMCLYHKNLRTWDNRLDNLGFISKKDLADLTGCMSKSKATAKVDIYGNVVEWYRSASEAGRKNYVSYQSVLDRANQREGKTPKDEYALLNGYTFRFMEDIG